MQAWLSGQKVCFSTTWFWVQPHSTSSFYFACKPTKALSRFSKQKMKEAKGKGKREVYVSPLPVLISHNGCKWISFISNILEKTKQKKRLTIRKYYPGWKQVSFGNKKGHLARENLLQRNSIQTIQPSKSRY